MDKMQAAILKQMEGQRINKHCQHCNKDTVFIIEGSGVAKCTEPECNFEYKIDFTEMIKDLKSMGVTVG